jgi:hypothetical protein
MSALGQKQTCAVQEGMSALPPKADMCAATSDVRLVPIADIATVVRHNERDRQPCLQTAPEDTHLICMTDILDTACEPRRTKTDCPEGISCPGLVGMGRP